MAEGITRGDLEPAFQATLRKKNPTTGQWEPVDLTSARNGHAVHGRR